MNAVVTIDVALPVEAQAVADEAVKRITAIQARVAADIVDIGRELIRVKEAVGHGRFAPWLKDQFNWTERTAQNYMSVAERFGSNTKPISHLPLATVYRLAAPSTPAPVREKLVERIEAGEQLGRDDIAHELKEAKREAAADRDAERKIASRNPKLSADQVKAKRAKQKLDRAERFARDRQEREEQDAAMKQAAIDFVSILTEDQRQRLSAAIEVGASRYLGFALDAAGLKP